MSKMLGMILFTLLLIAPAHAQRSVLQEAVPHEHFRFLTPTPQHHTTQPEETRLSYWGYRHKELHALGVVDELIANTKQNCCNGIDSGECRVSEVDLPHGMVQIDGQWCPVTKNTAIVAVEALSYLKHNENEASKALAVVCASRNHGGCTTTAYCVGVTSGQ